MKKKKLKILIPLIVSGCLIIPIATTLTSCSVFVPTTKPNIPPTENSPKPTNPIERIDFSSSLTVKKSFDKALEKIKTDFNKNFNQFPDPNNPKNFGFFENYCPLNLGYPNGLIQLTFNKFKEWYETDNADYIASGYYNILNILFEFPWIWYLGINYYLLSFYDWCNSNTYIEPVNYVLKYLPIPIDNHAYIDLINNSISNAITEKLFKEYWLQANQLFLTFFNSQTNQQTNDLSYYLKTLEYNMNCIKTMWNLTIPKSFQESTGTNQQMTFYEFYLLVDTDPEKLKEQQTKIRNQFEQVNILIVKTKSNFFIKE